MFSVSKLRAPQRGRRVADQIAALLVREQVDTVFGIPGGTISPINDALLEQPQVKTFVTRHESEAVWAACGHALVSGRVGVVFVTSGPGVTNALTGLASAKCDRVPVVILAGEVPRNMQGRGALQDGSAHNLDMRSVTRSLAKAVFEIAEPRTALTRIAEAFRIAREGLPGPVVVSLPLDVLMAEVPPCEVAFASVETRTTFDAQLLESVQSRLIDEPRPLLFVGTGLRRGAGPEKLLAFAERYQLPVATTPKAKGVFPESHPLSLGVFGLGGHPSATRYAEAGIGTLLAIGTALGDLATEGFHPALLPERALIHVDMDPAVLGRSYPTDVAIVGPAVEFLDAMLDLQMRDAPLRPHQGLGVTHHADAESQREGSEELIAPSRAIFELQRSLPDDTLYILDAGEHAQFAVHYLLLNKPDQLLMMTGLGSMGSSVGVAIGAKLADPTRTVCVIIGDGGLTMVGLELLDAVAHRLPIVVAVLNDRRLGMCELGHDNVYGRAPEFSVPNLDLPAFAASIGARGHVVHRAGGLDALALSFEDLDGPVLLDVCIDRSISLPKRDRIGSLAARSRQAA